MLKSCQYCGKIHSRKYDCGKRQRRKKKVTQESNFHSSRQWTNKSIQIRERDKYMCQCCARNMKGTVKTHNYNNISVHHIEPLKEDWERRFDDDNLISLCDYHHERAEAGEIDREILHEIAVEQNGM